MLWVGLVPYLANCLVGLAAQLGWRSFGVGHHVLYAVVCVTAIASAWTAFHPALWVTLGALVLFPKARPGTKLHVSLAALGLLGYLVALCA